MVTWRYRCVFFFQAEDGIRDYKVTGVQTCALPISLGVTWRLVGQGFGVGFLCLEAQREQNEAALVSAVGSLASELEQLGGTLVVLRSEERRVGKECRSRWSPYH